ncbi:MAG: TIGR02453 family protein [Acidobacteria bacterium]|nr:TIGR02453 family protein [Acidobacteriota bacterium]
MAEELRFTPELFTFLQELKKNNNKEWFEQNRGRYLKFVRDPFLAFIAAFRPRLQNLSPWLVADPKPVGGSMLRIHRDLRFSRSKEPYKTMAAAYFHHQAGKENTPGIYLHLEPGRSFIGLGLWQPDTMTRRKVTDAISANPMGWEKSISGRQFRAACSLTGESLNRLPKQYDPEHPFAEDLKRKDFIADTTFSQQEVCRADFIEKVDQICQAGGPFLEFLTGSLGLPWRDGE